MRYNNLCYIRITFYPGPISMIAVNMVEFKERTGTRQQADRQTDGQGKINVPPPPPLKLLVGDMHSRTVLTCVCIKRRAQHIFTHLWNNELNVTQSYNNTNIIWTSPKQIYIYFGYVHIDLFVWIYTDKDIQSHGLYWLHPFYFELPKGSRSQRIMCRCLTLSHIIKGSKDFVVRPPPSFPTTEILKLDTQHQGLPLTKVLHD